MRALLWLAAGLATAGALIFGALTWFEPPSALSLASENAYLAGRIGALLVMVLVTALLVVLARQHRRAIRGLTVLLCVLVGGLILFSPTFEMGLYRPAPPRALVMLYGIPAVVLGVAAVALDQLRTSA